MIYTIGSFIAPWFLVDPESGIDCKKESIRNPDRIIYIYIYIYIYREREREHGSGIYYTFVHILTFLEVSGVCFMSILSIWSQIHKFRIENIFISNQKKPRSYRASPVTEVRCRKLGTRHELHGRGGSVYSNGQLHHSRIRSSSRIE